MDVLCERPSSYKDYAAVEWACAYVLDDLYVIRILAYKLEELMEYNALIMPVIIQTVLFYQ